jgi:hypothetical protein
MPVIMLINYYLIVISVIVYAVCTPAKLPCRRVVEGKLYYPPRVTSRNEDYHKLYRFSEENVCTMVRETFSGT